MTHLHTRPTMVLRSLALLLEAFCGCLPVWADEPADQLERARLLREFQEAPAPAASSEVAKTPPLPAAAIEIERLRATQSLRTRQFEDSQWRALIGDRQMQLNQPSTDKASESQWRAQTGRLRRTGIHPSP